jgi:tape measure domain-containing protein
MATTDTQIIISVESILRGLDKTLRGLSQIEKSLRRVADVKVQGGARTTTTQFDRAAISARRLELQQQRLAIQQQKIDQTTQRLVISQQRLNATQERVAKSTGAQADAHVRAFRAIERGARDAEREIRRSHQSVITFGNSLRSVGQGLASLGATLSVSLTAPIVAFGTASVAAAVRLDSLKRGLTAIVGSSAEASRQLNRLTELAKLPGIGFEEAIQGSIRLQAVGFSAAEAERNLREFANAVALTGGGREELARVTVQLGQLAAKGKVLSQDLRPIIEAAPAVGRALKEAFGTVNADDIAELTGSSREFLNVLVAELERLPRAAAGAKNSFENFRDTVFRAAAAIGDTLLPTLVELANIIGPVIGAFAEGFKNLPAPIRATVVALTAMLATLGPILFIFGQLGLGVGRLIVGFQQYNLQLAQTNAQLVGVAGAARGATASLAGLRIALIATGVGIIGLVAQTLLAAAAFSAFGDAVEKSAEDTEKQLRATEDQVQGLKEQVKFLDSLKDGVKRTADEQGRLDEIYLSLNNASRVRVEQVTDETGRTAALRAEVERLLSLRLQERDQLIATIAANLASAERERQANQARRQSVSDQIEVNTQLIQTLQRTGRFSDEVTEALRRQNISGVNVAQAIEQLQQRSERLAGTQGELITKSGELTEKGRGLANILRSLNITTADQIRDYLLLAQAMGKFEGNVEQVVPVLEKLVSVTREATKANDDFFKSLRSPELAEAGDFARELQKARRDIISDAAITAREAGKDFQNALEFFRGMARQSVRIRNALQREAEIRGKTIEEVMADALGGQAERGGTSLRNAEEQLSEARARVQQEAAEKSIAIEQARNDDQLRINESRFKAELVSFERFIGQRTRLQLRDVQGEIERQQALADSATEAIRRAQQRAGTTRGAEQVRAQVDEQQAVAARTAAETKIVELRSRQREIAINGEFELREFTKQRLADFRALSRELDEVVGKQLQAAEAAIDERFAEDLRRLNTQMREAGIGLAEATAAQDKLRQSAAGAAIEELTAEKARIDTAKRQLKALAEVQDVQEEIRRVQEEQRNLEQQLTFDVQFRGVAENSAIQQRLAGEAKVREAIEQQRVRLEVLLATLRAAGIEIPRALIEAINQLKVEPLGLGELPFVEQFRIAEKEFTRIQEELANAIENVERRIRSRDISEIQGAVIIRRLNGEKVEALEKQLAVLQQIAKQSDDDTLRRQAAAAGQQVKDVRAVADEVANLDRQLKSVAIDAFADSLSQLFTDLADNTQSAAEDIASFFRNVLNQVNQFIAQNLARQIAESLFPDPQKEGGGVFGFARRLFGGGAEQAAAPGGLGGAVGASGAQAAATALTTAGTTVATTLTAAGTTTAAALTTSSATFGVSVTTAAASFAATIVTAGAAFAAAVAAAAGAQAVGGIGSALGGGAGAATGAIVPATPGGRVIVAEGGYDEAVLTTDPKFATRQVAILREYLRRTRGLFGRVHVPEMATGGIISAREAELNLLNSISRTPSLSALIPADMVEQAGPVASPVSLRNINLIDKREMVRGYLRSAEGTIDIMNTISENAPDIGRRLGVR